MFNPTQVVIEAYAHVFSEEHLAPSERIEKRLKAGEGVQRLRKKAPAMRSGHYLMDCLPLR